MAVLRIVPDLMTKDVAALRQFYEGLFGLSPAMDMGWIATLTSAGQQGVQISLASEGGSGAPVPHLSIEVDDLDAVYDRATTQGHAITYPLTTEPWGVRRFFLRDPDGRILNILSHTDRSA